MKAVEAAFNQKKALVGAFSVITNLQMELFQALEGMSPPFRTEAHELAPVRPVLVTTHVHNEVTFIQQQILKSEQELSRHHGKDRC